VSDPTRCHPYQQHIDEKGGTTWREKSQANTMTNKTLGGARKPRRHPSVDGIMEVELPPQVKRLYYGSI